MPTPAPASPKPPTPVRVKDVSRSVLLKPIEPLQDGVDLLIVLGSTVQS